jgi:hypothetical protein
MAAYIIAVGLTGMSVDCDGTSKCIGCGVGLGLLFSGPEGVEGQDGGEDMLNP